MKLNEVAIDRPIFVVGCARSGTTIFHYMIGGHPDLAWFSNITSRLPWLPQLAAFSKLYPLRQLYDLPRPVEAFVPKPFEGYPIYNYCKPGPPELMAAASEIRLGAEDVVEAEAEKLKRMIRAHLKYQGRPRFMSKNIRNSFRLEYLNAIFPDALVVHCVRDPRATVASLLNWFRTPEIMQTWAAGKFDPSDWETKVKPVLLETIRRWNDSNQAILNAVPVLGERYKRIYYEDLTSDTKTMIADVLDFCQLDASEGFDRFVDAFNVRNMNNKYDGQFTPEHIQQIEALTGDLVREMGYAF